MKKEKGKEKKVDAPILFIIILFLFFVSFGILVLGFIKKRPASEDRKKDAIILEEGQKDKNTPLSDFFDEEFSKSGERGSKNEVLLENDPFRSVCGEGDKTPSVTSNTVCFY